MADDDPLLGVRVSVSPILPKTVKDGDGRDVELLGVMVLDSGDPLQGRPPRFMLLVGDPVEDNPRDRPHP